jgi:hypothetical protein
MTTPDVRDREFRVRYFMRSVFQLAIILSLLGVAIPAVADQSVAILHPMGSVSVNDIAVARPIPVFVGDRITTGDASTATVVSEGTQVAVSANSSIVYMPHEVMVLRNSAVISTVNGMMARTGALKISPEASAPAQFAVIRSDSGTRVTATNGALSLQNGAQNVRLAAGNSLEFDLAEATNASAGNGTLIPSPNNVTLNDSNGNNNNPCPPRRCQKPPESPIRPCHPGYYYDDNCHCEPPPPPPPPPHHH